MQTAMKREHFNYSIGSTTREKALWQGLSRHTRRRKGAKSTHRHCIKDGVFIDPPYNTSHDFVYNDDFTEEADSFLSRDGQFDVQGNRLTVNSDSNGRFHTDWLNMLYPRLRIAHDFLVEDGVIFISIDDNEVENLKKIANEVFGSQNFVAQLVWEWAYAPKNDAKFISNSHDYVLMYAKNLNSFTIGRLPRTEEANARYSNPDNDPRGPWKPSDMSVKTYNAACDYPITTPSGRVIEPPASRCWRLSKIKDLWERINKRYAYTLISARPGAIIFGTYQQALCLYRGI